MTAARWWWLAVALAWASAWLGDYARGISPDDLFWDPRGLKLMSGLLFLFAVASIGMSVIRRGEADADGD